MNKKIFKGIFVSCIITMLACLVLIFGVLYDHFYSKFKDDLRAKTELVALGMNSLGEDYLYSLDDIDERVTHIASDGRLLYDSEIDIKTAENHSERAEFKQAVKNGIGESVRDSGTLGKQRVYCAVLLEDKTVIRLSMTQNEVWLLLLGIMPPIVFIFITIIILSAVLASVLSKRIVKPINEIDPDYPEKSDVYEELSPFIKKIIAQKKRIAREKEELYNSREQFKIITENMSEGILIIDENVNILSCNNAAIRLLSEKNDIAVGQNVLLLNSEKQFVKAIKNGLDGKNNECVLEINKKVLKIIVSAVTTGKNISGAVIIVLDVTEQEKREQLRREFTSNVSHELKTPLTSIYGISDMLKSGMVKNEDVCGFAEDINKEADRLIHLVEDIIRLSRLDEGAFVDDKKQIDLFDIINDTIKILKPMAEGAKVSLIAEGESCNFFGQPTMLGEMIYNLCENAIKYNKTGGFVKVCIEKQSGEIVLKVEDSGIGIPLADIERVFERFYRVDKSHSTSVGGTGLGLSIVKHAVAYHQGKIDLTSKEGEGTVVTVTLPLKSNN